MKHININTIIAFILAPLTQSTLPPFDFDSINLADFLSFNEFRSIDGSNNNEQNPSWGSTSSPMQRCIDPDYSDGFNAISGKTRMNPRELSNVLSAQTPADSDEFTNNRFLTQFAWQWGQFIDHDITLISEDTTETDPTKEIDIYVPCCDPVFDSECVCDADIFIEVSRTPAFGDTGSNIENPRNQFNDITSFIDASMIYGSDQDRANELRTFQGGILKTGVSGDGETILPLNVNGFANAPNDLASNFFLAGDPRSNEQVGLMAIHTLFVRLHNRLAGRIRPGIRSSNPAATQSDIDELTYQYAKLLVTAIIQKITFKDWLPALFGDNAINLYLSAYQQYDETINPGICSIFSSSAFRFGHSMLPQKVPIRLANCNRRFAEDLELKDVFFTPDLIQTNANDYLRGIVNGFSCTLSNEIDTKHTDAIRNFLFQSAVDEVGNPIFGHLDLVSINIQRGREHGLPDYNAVRREMGLSALTSFDGLSSDAALNHDFEVLYDGDIEDIDVFLGGLAEDHLEGGSFGELTSKIVLEQFGRLRDGDRFWYENYITDGDLKNWIENVKLKNVLAATLNVNDIQPLDETFNNVFQNTQAISIFAADPVQPPPPPPASAEGALIGGKHDDNTDWGVTTEEYQELNGLRWLLMGIVIIGGILALLLFVWIYIHCNSKKEGNDETVNGSKVDGDDKEIKMEVVTKKEDIVNDGKTETAECDERVTID